MRVHGPKLFGDWRDFGREYAIIVLGVLTALLAQSVAEDLNWRHKVKVANSEMSNELSAGDGPQAYVRVASHDCVTARLDDIRKAVESSDRLRSRELIDSF